MRIPVVAISDDKLAFALGALFVNLCETADKDTFYELTALVSPDFGTENQTKIESIAVRYSGRCSVQIIRMDSRFDKIKNETGYIANACAYKMCLAEVLPEYDKVVYLDTDLLIFRDLSALYQTDLGDNYIGGVFSLEHYLNRRELAGLLQIPDMASYVNAGVLLFNLKKIREDGIEAKLQTLIGSYKDSVDQHIFNKICYGHIAFLNPQWNVFQSSKNLFQSDRVLIGMTRGECKRISEEPWIFHYTGQQKPWLFYNIDYAWIWLTYYKKTPYVGDALSLAFYGKREAGGRFLSKAKARKRYYWNSFLYCLTFNAKFKGRMWRYRQILKEM